ncbi:MAG TPA: hypothetical protein VK558_13660 [Patescibacteria group bacterium]|nr:hypothetical protein [Patescibacteria group bacterium]
MAVTISVKSDVKALQRALTDFAKKQIPFATANALNAVAKRVQAAGTKQILRVLPTATPFTQKSVKVRAARKSNLTAVVYMGDITASYLEPFEFGGKHSLGTKRGLLVPKNVAVNQYGNLAKNKLETLKGRQDIFVGAVTTKGGVVNGVWQRVTDTSRASLLNAKGKRLKGLNRAMKDKDTGKMVGHLKLLIRFEDALPVKQRLGYFETARSIVDKTFKGELAMGLRKAMASAR